jgi:hypothetical protein
MGDGATGSDAPDGTGEAMDWASMVAYEPWTVATGATVFMLREVVVGTATGVEGRGVLTVTGSPAANNNEAK